MHATRTNLSYRLLSQLWLFTALLAPLVHAGPLLEKLAERRAVQEMDGDEAAGEITLPAGARVLRDISYGSDAKQRMDVYLPAHANHAPVIVMVHGGGWRWGDKAASAVVQNKVTHWLPKGAIFISVNNRLLPTDPLTQAADVATALATAQRQAASWDGDANHFVLIGHSAGAHLVALLSASPELARKAGARPWLGTVALDSAVLDVAQIMNGKHARLYDSAFGTDPAYWQATSPRQQLHKDAVPLLAVCSSRRSDSCPQAEQYVSQSNALNVRAQVLREDLSHREINAQLGLPGNYTDAVDAFLGSLDPALKH